MCPSKFRVRGIFRGLVYRVARPLQKRNINPDSVTYLSLLIALVSLLALALFRFEPLFGILVFTVGFLDGVDGAVAKGAGTASQAGSLTDSVIDKVSEVIILTAIALTFSNGTVLYLSVPLWVLLCLCGWLLTSYTRSRAESLGVTDLDIGIGARSERLLTLVLFSLVNLLLWGLVVVTLMGLLTAAYRFYHYKRELLSSTLQ